MGKLITKTKQKYFEALIEGDRLKCRGLLDQARQGGIPAADLLLDVIWRSMDKIAELFSEDRIDFVTEHIKAISRPEVAAVSGLVIANPNERKTSLQNYLFKYRKRGAKQLGEKNPIPFKYLITNNMSVKRKVVEKCGIFDEIYIGYGGEDTDYAIRLWELYPNGLRFSSSAVSIDCQNETLYDLQVKMNKYGSTNYLRLLDRYPDYTKELAGNWIATIKGKVVFNPVINFLVKLIYFVIPVPYFVRYSIAYSLIIGARNPEEGIPKFQSKR